MFGKIISVILLLAMFNFIVGCSYMKKIPVEELRYEQKEKIKGIELRSDENVEFDIKGGKFNPKKHEFIGKKLNGEKLRADTSEVKSIKITINRYNAYAEKNINLKTFLYQSRESIFGAELYNGQKIRFIKNTGYIDTTQTYLIGSTRDSIETKTNLNEVKYLLAKRSGAVGGAFAGIAIITLVGIGMALAFQDFSVMGGN
jgi:hypothetical protein